MCLFCCRCLTPTTQASSQLYPDMPQYHYVPSFVTHFCSPAEFRTLGMDTCPTCIWPAGTLHPGPSA